ncbi:MAG: hypothetical protein HWN68_00045 [Desulfobacterales bacterium]|nr:hypothetical protein [Desulfobacterales bacterium]
MKQVVIENPVINSPFEEPRRHFLFSEEGITNEIAEARRVSSYFVSIANSKKKSKQKKKLGTQESSFFSGFPVSILPSNVSETVYGEAGTMFRRTLSTAVSRRGFLTYADLKRTGDSIVIWRDGKVVKVPADQIEVCEPQTGYSVSEKGKK